MLMFHETEVKRIGESFRRMKPTLEQIEFKKTRTVSIHDEAFSRLTQLNSLVIVYNSLKTIKRSMFPSSLYFLDLTGNKLTDLPDDIFTDMPALRDVLLEKNQLKHFSSAVLERLYDTTLQQVTLSDNPIICDCSVKWYTQKEKRSVRVTGNCDIPENLHGWRLIQLSPGDFGYCRK
ncbi:LRRCT domain-containing protein [Caerostris darwini]|uniref:LRRCT domain-containing protein n=1 Tax=Caerostris darwini TaxID=1538125 RepID=A0AAV4VLG5_9ARAC|nr:LRRCT domain-containing protein [Caerostris darwini]